MKLLKSIDKFLLNLSKKIVFLFWGLSELCHLFVDWHLYLIVLVESEDLYEKLLSNEMKKLEKKGYKVLVIPNKNKENNYQETLIYREVKKKQEPPIPLWIYPACF